MRKVGDRSEKRLAEQPVVSIPAGELERRLEWYEKQRERSKAVKVKPSTRRAVHPSNGEHPIRTVPRGKARYLR